MKVLIQLVVMGAIGLFGCGSRPEPRHQPARLINPGVAQIAKLSTAALPANRLAPTWSHSR